MAISQNASLTHRSRNRHPIQPFRGVDFDPFDFSGIFTILANQIDLL